MKRTLALLLLLVTGLAFAQTGPTFNYRGGVATTTSKLSAFAATTSAELAGVISDETGSGAAVFATSPTLTTPAITGAATLTADTVANIVATTPAAGSMRWASNLGVAGGLLVYNGTRWKPVGGQLVLAKLLTTVASIANSETILLQANAMQPGLLKAGDSLEFLIDTTKSGTTDGAVVTLRLGTAGTTSDTAVLGNTTVLAAANRTVGTCWHIKLVDNTTSQRSGSIGSNGHCGAASATASPATIAITDMSTNALIPTITTNSSSTNDTVGATDARIIWVTPFLDPRRYVPAALRDALAANDERYAAAA